MPVQPATALHNHPGDFDTNQEAQEEAILWLSDAA